MNNTTTDRRFSAIPAPLAGTAFQLAAYRDSGWRLISLHAKQDGENLDIAGSRKVAQTFKLLLNASFSGADLADRFRDAHPGCTVSQVQFSNESTGKVITIDSHGQQIIRDLPSKSR